MSATAPAGELRRTPLYADHRRLGARMVDFGGWEMPVQYSGILDEHRAVRSRAGLFDVSHMGEIELAGPHALRACQEIVSNDPGKLRDGGAQYSAMCLPSGGIVDDVVYYRLGEDRYLFCVNASNQRKDFEWIREHRCGAEVRDRSAEFGQIALQGPRSPAILAPLTDLDVGALRSFTCAEATVAGVPALVSRTGYTGEDGFELYVDAAKTGALWNALLEAGRTEGLVPVGLGARDTLRLERALLLYGNDIDETTTPLEAGLGWVVKLDRGDFVGKEALLRQKREGVVRRLVGLEVEDGSIARHGHPVWSEERVVGSVTSGTKSPTLGRAIALGYVESAASAVGQRVEIEIRGRRRPAKVAKVPFYSR